MSNLATVTHLRPSQRPVERRVAEVEDGYTRLANALYEELIGADLTKNQSKVAHAICRKTYGYGKKMDRISDSQLAQITRLPRQKVNKAKNELIAMKVILREGQQIGPNKNIEEWQIEGCHYSGDNVTALVTKSVTKTVTALSPKQGHTKETITKEKRNNKNTMSESVRTECEKSHDRHEETDKAFEEIFWCAGMRKAAREIASRLGEHRCRLVTLPYKDINECLMNGVTEDEIWQYIGTASYFDPEELYSAREFYQDTINAFYGKQQYLFNPPWESLADKFQFREAELTLVNGVNGHGKTEVVGHMALEAMRQGVKTCIASLELKPGILLKRLTRQATCCKMPPVLEIDSAFKFYDERLWVFGLTGTAKADRLIEIFDYARRRYGIQLFIIDSLMKCGIGDDDYNGQKAFVDSICDFKNKTNSHVILVTHSRKGDSEEKPTGKMDVKGSGAITDLTDNLFIIWRNKARERALQRVQSGEKMSEKDEQLLASPASVLMLEKQRNGEGWEGGVPLFLDEQSHQFLQLESGSPYSYIANMPKSEYDEAWRQENVTEY